MDLQAVGKRSSEWDMNNWRWDGDLFIANPVNSVPSGFASRQFIPVPTNISAIGNSSNSSPSCSGEVNLGNEKGKELEKRRVVVIEDDHMNDEEERSLSLKLGGNDYSVAAREVGNWEGNGGKKTKVTGGSASHAACQVESCGVDLSNAKDYHRRHKVCEMHSKASKALVGNVMQRFCQQCSRFHALQEFDEGKRSCRRRLAGHNRRRRKTNPNAAANGNALIDDQTSSYLLISLLKIIANLHSNRSDQTTDQDMLTRLLKGLQGNRGENGEQSINRPLLEQQNSLNDHVFLGNSEVLTNMISNGEGSSRPLKEHLTVPVSVMEQQHVHARDPSGENIQTPSAVKPSLPNNYAALSEVRENAVGPSRVNNFDLNDTYIDSDDGTDDAGRFPVPMNVGTSSLDYPSHHLSPPQTSRNSDSASAQSPSSSNGDAQSRTDRIVFKLFGKEPNDLPLVLRAQIVDWLSHSPTDIESYIRPGCIILTVYLCQAESAWDEICYDLTASLSRLLDVADATFWRTGWVYIRVQHQIALVHNGRVVLDTYLPPSINNYSKILSVKPIAISASERTQFLIKGFNLARPATRLLCAINGNYTVLENTCELADSANEGDEELQSVEFSCSIPTLTGRGFIEIEDQTFSSSSFPFIVAEKDVCSEIRILEDALDFDEIDAGTDVTRKVEAKNVALDFIHEMGWLLHRSQLKSRLGHLDPHTELFPLGRFKWLMAFSMDHEWCAVVKKLLNILLNGTVGIGEHSSMELVLSEMGLLHRAVRRNSRPLVEFLLRYVPDKSGRGTEDPVGGSPGSFLFRPDMPGPAGLTPLHIAAGKDGSEDVLDALTDDPGMVGIEAWKNARDSTDSTPEDYARLRGHYSYIHLVQKKISRRPAAGHVVVDIPGTVPSSNTNNQKQNEGFTNSFQIGQTTSRRGSNDCKLCHQKLAYITGRRSHLYRPSMLSMVAIAAVCVCVALLFKSCPEVIYVFRPFRWELLEYGAS